MKLNVNVLLAWLLTFGPQFASPAVAEAEPLLTSVTVRFDVPANCDDRDPDTRIDARIVRQGHQIAHLDDIDPNKRFADPSTHGPYALQLDAKTETRAKFPMSTTKVRITPKDGVGGPGNDTWCTRILLHAVFSDGSTWESSSCVTLKLSEVTPDAQFINLPCE